MRIGRGGGGWEDITVLEDPRLVRSFFWWEPHKNENIDRNITKVRVKLKLNVEQAMEAQRGSRGMALLFLWPRYWVKVCGQSHVPATLLPGNKAGTHCTQGSSGRVWKISPPPGFDTRTVQPVTSRYTDWAIPAPGQRWYNVICHFRYLKLIRQTGFIPLLGTCQRKFKKAKGRPKGKPVCSSSYKRSGQRPQFQFYCQHFVVHIKCLVLRK